MKKNRLVNEKSLYLKQHAHNPVDWYPWGEEAFAKARKENKLMFISIGYSSCHWCHVMEQEVFENKQAAEYLNQNYVCVKVDREERPDIDNVYMLAVQLMTRTGGWPLNCFTLSDGRPVYGGTYFPLERFLQISKSLIQLYKENPEDLLQYAENLQEGIRSFHLTETSESILFEEEKLKILVEKWASSFDDKEGGTLPPPKFPLPNNYEFLLQYGKRFKDNETLDFVHLTLQKIICGGIYDQIEGGLMRYSTDVYWKIPHFEKMLYDNAQFLSLLSHAYSNRPNAEYLYVIRQTIQWLNKKMKTEEGFYKSAIDADSDEGEGAFYVWKKEEIKELFPEDFEKVFDLYQINARGYWEDGKYILCRKSTFEEIKNKYNWSEKAFEDWFLRVNNKLLDFRNKRKAPIIDDKIIFSWNCMLAKGLLDASLVLEDQNLFSQVLELVEKLEKRFVSSEVIYRISEGEHKVKGFLEDYAYYISLCVHLHQFTMANSWLKKAEKWLGFVQKEFPKEGNLFYYSSGDFLLKQNSIEINDNVIPASNSVLANSFWDFGVITSQNQKIEWAEKMLKSVYEKMESYGSGYSNWAILLQKVVRGDLLVNYFSPVSKKEHWKLLRKIPDAVLFQQEKAKTQGEEVFQICFQKQCSLPEKGFKNILSRVEEISARKS